MSATHSMPAQSAVSAPELEKFPHRFSDPGRVEQALAVRKGAGRKLEWLGDCVLSTALADLLLERHSERSLGELGRAHSFLSSNGMLSQLGIRIGLPGHELPDKYRMRLADVVEALVGAVLLDAGYLAARECVAHLFADWLDGRDESFWGRDAKSTLKERCERENLPQPVYRAQSDGKGFAVNCVFAAVSGTGRGGTVVAAEMAAAAAVLAALAAKGRARR